MEEGTNPDRGRASLLVLATLTILGVEHRVKVKNLSAGGLMAEPNVGVRQHQAVSIKLPNLGEVQGHVVWANEQRFGMAFDSSINPQDARVTITQPQSNHNCAIVLSHLRRL